LTSACPPDRVSRRRPGDAVGREDGGALPTDGSDAGAGQKARDGAGGPSLREGPLR